MFFLKKNLLKTWFPQEGTTEQQQQQQQQQHSERPTSATTTRNNAVGITGTGARKIMEEAAAQTNHGDAGGRTVNFIVGDEESSSTATAAANVASTATDHNHVNGDAYEDEKEKHDNFPGDDMKPMGSGMDSKSSSYKDMFGLAERRKRLSAESSIHHPHAAKEVKKPTSQNVKNPQAEVDDEELLKNIQN